MTIRYQPDPTDIPDVAAFAPPGTTYDVNCDAYYHIETGQEVVPDPRDAVLWTLWAVKPESDDGDSPYPTFYHADANVHRHLARSQLVNWLAIYIDRNTQLRHREAGFELRYFVGTRCELDDDGQPVCERDETIVADAQVAATAVAEKRAAVKKMKELRVAEQRREADRARDLAALAKLRAQYPDIT